MRVVCIIQARMGSTRLPGKVLKELDGHPMIYHTLTRASKAKYIDKIVLATSVEERDTPLANYVESLGIDVFRGSEDYVLERYREVARTFEGDIIVRLTGDCPLIDPVILDYVISNFMISGKDYVRLDVPNTYLRGFDVEVFSREALERVFDCVDSKTTQDEDLKMYKEHVTYYMYTHPQEFKVGHVKSDNKVGNDYNLSVDTIEDFKRVSRYIQEGSYKMILSKVMNHSTNK